MSVLRSLQRILAVALLSMGLYLSAGCGSVADQTLLTDSPAGAVYLQHLSERGTTMRYGGAVKSFKASHPIDLAPDVLAKALSGLSLGISATDDPAHPRGIKPAPLFSAQEVAFLAPAIAAALKRAQPDQRVKFQTGSLAENVDGTLYVNENTFYVTLNHYHSPADKRDDQVGIYILSFAPVEAQARIGGPQTWMEIEPNQPHVAVSISALASLPAPILPAVPVAAPAPVSAPSAGNDTPSMKAAMDKQAQELDSLKAELDALKKQIGGQSAPAKTNPSPK
ncbi:MAG: hypothetical protein IT389_11975 [Nitrospira sp.]|nr:hypothetical protein [Nitrospira sp.]